MVLALAKCANGYGGWHSGVVVEVVWFHWPRQTHVSGSPTPRSAPCRRLPCPAPCPVSLSPCVPGLRGRCAPAMTTSAGWSAPGCRGASRRAAARTSANPSPSTTPGASQPPTWDVCDRTLIATPSCLGTCLPTAPRPSSTRTPPQTQSVAHASSLTPSPLMRTRPRAMWGALWIQACPARTAAA